MAKKILNVVDVAYRATLEEQDDPVLWLTHALKSSGADIAVLLRGAAVNYLVQAQDAAGLSFGGRAQTQPPQLSSEVSRLIEKGVAVHYLEEDVRERGIAPQELIAGALPLPRTQQAELLGAFDQVWKW
ncbi:DsrE family protein [Vitiosangium sp. GDMCC 1.1324]|uniref:DsrE family protein n=1 Tax=Vitiosangium sp. (strain GDMCC 1.1324) TaxID=2138576 RepID=UPI000D334CAB|nr:DsrE family protein [Vitiosangium sp. GDMCC 1.1324]PTL79851.1 hypothetical protein DAT35_30910 [Vitiosangium sp. GDMCC 1.1324]